MSDIIVLKGGNIFDGFHEELIRGKNLVLKDGKIERIAEPTETLGDVRVLDVSGKFISPGFIDCHMHIMLEEVPKNKDRNMTMFSAGGEIMPNAESAAAFLAVENCRLLLESGFTTVMDGGGRNFVECALKEAIGKGFVQGPALMVAGKQLTTNKAHFIDFSVEPYGPYGMRKVIRDLVWWGVDFIKMQLSPPIRMAGRNPNAADFTEEEIRAAIEEAHNYGRAVHAHLRGPAAIKTFLKSGGDYVVHGTGIDDEGIELMLKYGKILLPTLLSPSEHPTKELVESRPKSMLDGLMATARVHWEGIRKAYRAGVPMAFSTDSGTLGNHVGLNAREFENLVEIGMRPVEALRTATSVAAKVTGCEDRIGSIRPGFDADLVVLDGDPMTEIKNTRNVYMTVAKGKPVFCKNWF